MSVPAHLLQVFADDASLSARIDAAPTDAHFGEEGIVDIRVADAPVLVIDLAHARNLHEALGALLTSIETIRETQEAPVAVLHAIPSVTRHLTPTL